MCLLTWINVADKFATKKPKYSKFTNNLEWKAHSFGDPVKVPRFEEDRQFVSEATKKKERSKAIDKYFVEEICNNIVTAINLKRSSTPNRK